ncbi:helix-turn-helix domain-containing protein [Fervidibacter sacchari]
MKVGAKLHLTPFPDAGPLSEWAWVWDNTEIRFISAWDHEFSLGWQLPPQKLPNSLMVFVREGTARWTIGGENFVAGSGNLIFVPEGVRHSAASVGANPFCTTFVHFTARFLGVQCVLDLLGFPPKVDGDENFARAAFELSRLFHLKPQGWKLRGTALVTDILLRCVQEQPQRFRPTASPKDAKAIKLLCPAFQLFASNDGKVTVSDLAKAAMCSPTHLRRLFQKAIGMSPKEWLLERRLQKAAQLLQTTDKTVQQIADICGFESLSHFTRYFKAKFGSTPSQYRSMVAKL